MKQNITQANSFTTLNTVKKLQEGKSKAKASFDAKSLTKMTFKHNAQTMLLCHPDKYTFQLFVNGNGEYFYGTLGQAILKLELLTNPIATKRSDKKIRSKEFNKKLLSSKFNSYKPNDDCSSVSSLDIKKILTNCKVKYYE